MERPPSQPNTINAKPDEDGVWRVKMSEETDQLIESIEGYKDMSSAERAAAVRALAADGALSPMVIEELRRFAKRLEKGVVYQETPVEADSSERIFDQRA